MNQAKFYGYVNNKLKSKSFAPSLKDEEGSVADSDEDKANLLRMLLSTKYLKMIMVLISPLTVFCPPSNAYTVT